MAEALPATTSDYIKGAGNNRPRSILKRPKEVKKEAGGLQWDEMNIIATLHPKDKEYGHMKIDEPKTPYNRGSDDEATEEKSVPSEVVDRAERDPDAFVYKEPPPPCVEMDSGSGDEASVGSTPEETARKEVFKKKRKLHYNEGSFMKQAREMARRSMLEDDD
eukprot:TRINITY_DN2994_c0_g1_i1.p1 TRINITY_DN2994_c0_g1~~TRINITY_DN2994_c0_g1_i1.p1  ORF type:complete len:163 (+),score=54.65 TRINITY_DN2994_c0_g1_i1:41-529(+)